MWLPPAPPPPDPSGLTPWQPGPPVDGLSYVVVDELHDGIAGLVVSPWPHVDERGRLVFAGEAAARRVAAPVATLRALLRDRTPVVPGGASAEQREALRERDLAIGDVFAARIGEAPPWLEPPVLDLTAPAREQAKAQTSAALSGAVGAVYLDVVAEEMAADAGH